MTAIPFQPCRDCPGDARRHSARETLGDVGRRVWATLREWRRRSRERQELAALDDRALLDIGLTRADAEFIINKPFWRE